MGVDRSEKRPGKQRQHVRIYCDVLDSHAWLALDTFAQAFYIAMRRQLKSFNNGDIEATLSTMRHRGSNSSATLSKSLRALLTVGLIAVTRRGGMSQGGKEPTLYRFTDEPAREQKKKSGAIPASKATDEWKCWPSRAAAEAAIEAAHVAAKRPDHRNSSRSKNAAPIHAANRIGSCGEPEAGFTDSRRERSGPPVRSFGEPCETASNSAATRTSAHAAAEQPAAEQLIPHGSANEHLLHIARAAPPTPPPSLLEQLQARKQQRDRLNPQPDTRGTP